MVDWLDGFDWEAGELKARIRCGAVVNATAHLGDLRDRGVPDGGRKVRRAFSTSFDQWVPVPTARYLTAFEQLESAGENHTVFSLRCGRCEYLVPALVLLRGLFPLIASALAYVFTPRPLEVLCIPICRAGHWTVAMPGFTGPYKARFRRSTVEALTWANVYPSARNTWHSVYRSASEGRMSLELPNATVRVVPYGLRLGNTVHVTRLVVNALLAHEEPAQFAAGVSPSFVLMKNSEPLAPGANAYYENHEEDLAAQYRLSDEEWVRVRQLCEPPRATKGRQARDSARDVADGLVIRAASLLPWSQIPVRVAANALALHSQGWRADGRLHRLLSALRQSRGDEPYLMECMADDIAARHSRKDKPVRGAA